jgi:cell division protease FtsH
VFLGEDLMHTRDYSEDTSRVVDEEIERILRAQELRAESVLSEHRGGLESVAAALLEHETIDGREIARLVDMAYGRPVHELSTGEEVPDSTRFATSLVGGGSDSEALGVAVPFSPSNGSALSSDGPRVTPSSD